MKINLIRKRKTGTRLRMHSALTPIILSGLIVSACSDNSDSTAATDEIDTTDPDTTGMEALDTSLFIAGGLASDPTIVDCTLSDGTETTCYQFITAGTPAGSAVGPFCPQSITDTATDVGIWFDGGSEVYDVDGDFIVNLPNLYGDANWSLYDQATGLVNVTTTQEACEGAAQPNVEAQYQNHCVECSLDYYDGGISTTLLIPTTPVPAGNPGAVSANAGIALNGVVLAAPAPVSDILSNYTIAAFDDCGGHINPAVGYHYHAATGCTEESTESDGHAGLIGYALDGYGIYGRLDSEDNESTGLDECRGETDEVRGYHYHAATPSENMFVGCFHGATEGDGGQIGRPPGGMPPQ